MPAYGAIGSTVPTAIYEGDVGLAFNVEAPLVNQASIAFAPVYVPGADPGKLCVELQFSAAPGAFEFDVQEAETDVAGAYTALAGGSGVLNAVNANNFSRYDLSPFVGKFVRLFTKTPITNVGVTVIAKFTR